VTNDKRVEDAMMFGDLPGNADSHEGVLTREVRRLRSELDRAKKLLTLAVGVMANECVLGEMAFKTLAECREYVAYDAPKESKSK
jgi:hypothetical protein